LREIFWLGLGDEEAIKDLEKTKIGVIGSRLVLELLWRCGFGCIKYVGDFITPNDVLLDVTIKPLEANNYDVVHPMSDESYVVSYLYFDFKELKKQLKGCDIIIAHKHIEDSAKVAEELGALFMPNFITTFLPDGVSYFEVEIPKIKYDPVSYSLNCSLQVSELVKLIVGRGVPVIAPKAYIVQISNRGYLKKLRLKLKKRET